jgi:YD repeat-containing protein
VKFYLEDRTDAPVMYTSNAPVKTTKRLKTIEVYGNGQLVRKYGLTYNYSSNTNRSLLTTVIQYGNNGIQSFPPISSTYLVPVIGFSDSSFWLGHSGGQNNNALGDFNGDGKTDMAGYTGSDGLWHVTLASEVATDLLKSISNGIGAISTLEYKSSSAYTNIFLPFIVQALSSLTVDDGNGNISTTIYDYSGGYYDYMEREFRGFEYVKTIAPNGTYTETWFHQDDIYKGLIKEQITSDSSGNIYTRTVNIYNSTSPYTGVNFPYLWQKGDYVYDGTSTPKQARMEFWYDSYGNITRKYFSGDVSIPGDEREEYTEYNYDTTNWIVSLPSHTYIKNSNGIIKAQKWFTYYPNTGNLWTEELWLDGETNPVTIYTYDSYGNVETITDPMGYQTIITYDSLTHTYPVVIQNSLGHTIQKTYDYRFGKVLTETDPNGNTTTYEYDVFGRITKITNPNDTNSTYGTITYYYLDFGTVGSQRIVTYATEQSGTGNYIRSETYFDGLGRTIKTRSEGPDGKVIVTEAVYNQRGLIEYESLPYFEGSETPRWTYYEYDPIGRLTKITYPDGTFTTTNYLKGTLTYIDANGHKKVEVKDVYGRIIEVQEYTGDEANGFTLYATTQYEYDVLGNLIKVTDANGNQTIMTYDTLSRKISMDDPDMGYWEYGYDANDNLTYQKDAKNQEITFQYDALNRITKKTYPDQTYIEYRYDESFSTNPIGRLTTLIDSSGTTKYYYDKLGQTIKTVKTIDGIDYTTETTYDALGRIDTITYPDGTQIKYIYDTGGNLYQVKNVSTGYVYVTYSNYNALGQAGTATYGNGVTTIYQYYPDNNRLFSITTNSPSAGGLMNISYYYDYVGNITQITDHLDNSKTRTLVYDEFDRLIETNSVSYGGTITYQYDKIGNMTYNSLYGYYFYEDPYHVHAVTRVEQNGQTIDTYSYDANGNMTSGAGRTITYDYDNRPMSITYNGMTIVFIYDAYGKSKKVTPNSTTIYERKGACNNKNL